MLLRFISISQSCIESIGLTTLATATAYSFFEADQAAGLLCLPYVGGLIYLSIENYLAFENEKHEKELEALSRENTVPTPTKRKAL